MALTIVDSQQVVFTTATTPASFPSVSWQTGDLIIVIGATEAWTSTLVAPTVAGLTFTAIAGTPLSATSQCYGGAWQATAASSSSGAISIGESTTPNHYGAQVWVWRGHNGVGVIGLAQSTAITVSMAMSANSGACMGLFDFSAAAAGFTGTPTVNVERADLSDATHYTVWVADWLNQAVGTRNYGITSGPTSANTMIAVEVKELAVGGSIPVPAPLFGPGAHGPLTWQWQQQSGADGVTSQTFTASLGGSVTATGALAKLDSKALAGSSTATGALTRQTAKALAGSSTPSGTLARLVAKALAGSSTPSGSLARQAQKALAGSSTGSGAIAKLIGKALAGSVTPSGVLTTIKVVLRSFGGSVTATGALAKQVAKALAGSTAASGVLAKQDAKALAGSSTPTGAIAKAVAKALSGSTTPSGALSTIKVVLRSFGGSVTATGTLARQIAKGLAGSSTPTGTVAKQAKKTVAGTVTSSGALSKLISKAYAGALTAIGTLTTSTPSGGSGPYAMATLSQDAAVLNLEWISGDPISLAITVQAANWSGTYRAQIRAQAAATATLLGELTVVATFSAPDTAITMTMTAVLSALIPPGAYYWDLQQTGGPTRLRGTVSVRGEVTV